MENNYNNFRDLAQAVNGLSEITSKAYQGDKSHYVKQTAASLFGAEGTEDYKNYLSRDPSSEELYGVFSEVLEQRKGDLESSIQNDLEKIIKDAPEELVMIGARNTAAHRTGNEKHDDIARAHEDYIETKKLISDYLTPKTRLEAREKIIAKLDAGYDQRYAHDEEICELMKDYARFKNDESLIREYNGIVQKTEKKFLSKLKGNASKYLFENIKDLEDKSSFIGFLLSGDKKQLVQTAIANGDAQNAEMLSQEIRMDIESQGQSSEEVQNILMNGGNGYGNGESRQIIRTPRGIQRVAQNVPVVNAA